MTRLTEAEGRRRWDEAIRARGWQNSKLRLVMFDYRPAEHGPTLYRPAPAWPTIADDDNTADVEDYARVEQSLLAQGEPHSQRGAAAHSGCLDVQLVANPIPVRRGEIVATIERVMGKVHPLAITQEQILRAAFFVHLARELSQAIGTAEAAGTQRGPRRAAITCSPVRGVSGCAPATTWVSGIQVNRLG